MRRKPNTRAPEPGRAFTERPKARTLSPELERMGMRSPARRRVLDFPTPMVDFSAHPPISSTNDRSDRVPTRTHLAFDSGLRLLSRLIEEQAHHRDSGPSGKRFMFTGMIAAASIWRRLYCSEAFCLHRRQRRFRSPLSGRPGGPSEPATASPRAANTVSFDPRWPAKLLTEKRSWRRVQPVTSH